MILSLPELEPRIKMDGPYVLKRIYLAQLSRSNLTKLRLSVMTLRTLAILKSYSVGRHPLVIQLEVQTLLATQFSTIKEMVTSFHRLSLEV